MQLRNELVLDGSGPCNPCSKLRQLSGHFGVLDSLRCLWLLSYTRLHGLHGDLCFVKHCLGLFQDRLLLTRHWFLLHLGLHRNLRLPDCLECFFGLRRHAVLQLLFTIEALQCNPDVFQEARLALPHGLQPLLGPGAERPAGLAQAAEAAVQHTRRDTLAGEHLQCTYLPHGGVLVCVRQVRQCLQVLDCLHLASQDLQRLLLRARQLAPVLFGPRASS
mmetsp:Transcript_42222/g.117577  ORF Transcript_42222/g.117577 Transcript_42222/m.117577 type:complete len:219 (-) Transcript_42222:1173-1829(-)